MVKRWWRRDVPGWSGYVVVRSKADHEVARRDESQRGFTLIELLIVFVILPMIVGALAISLISVFSLQSSAANRIQDAGDTKVVSASFVKDVQSATAVTTEATSSATAPSFLTCGASTNQELALEWNNGQTVVSYDLVVTSNTSNSSLDYALVRNYCNTGASTTPTSSQNLLSDSTLSTVTAQAAAVTCPATVVTATCTSVTSAWLPSSSVSTVTLNVTEPASVGATASPYTYSLVASPRLGPASGFTNNPAFAPLTLLSTPTCNPSTGLQTTPSLGIGTNTTVDVDYGDGAATGDGSVADESTCKDSISGSGTLSAQTILSDTPSPGDSFAGSTPETPELSTYPWDPVGSQLNTIALAGQIDGVDPVTLTPATVSADEGTGTCTTPTNPLPQGGFQYGFFGYYFNSSQTSDVWTCTPGVYTDDPFGQFFYNGSNFFFQNHDENTLINFQPGNYYFEEGLTIPQSATANFASGTYVFDNYNDCTSLYHFVRNPNKQICNNYSNYGGFNFNFGFLEHSQDQNYVTLAIDDGAKVNATNVLFYVKTGSVYIGEDAGGLGLGNDGIHSTGIGITPLSGYDGVSIWDAASSTTTGDSDQAELGLGGGNDSYGGIYAPSAQIVDNNTGAISANFIVAQSASFAPVTVPAGQQYFYNLVCGPNSPFTDGFFGFYCSQFNGKSLSVSITP